MIRKADGQPPGLSLQRERVTHEQQTLAHSYKPAMYFHMYYSTPNITSRKLSVEHSVNTVRFGGFHLEKLIYTMETRCPPATQQNSQVTKDCFWKSRSAKVMSKQLWRQQSQPAPVKVTQHMVSMTLTCSELGQSLSLSMHFVVGGRLALCMCDMRPKLTDKGSQSEQGYVLGNNETLGKLERTDRTEDILSILLLFLVKYCFS